jgi:hypothetical protein
MSERELSGSVERECAMLVPDEVGGLWFRDGGITFQTSTPARGSPRRAILTLNLDFNGTRETLTTCPLNLQEPRATRCRPHS